MNRRNFITQTSMTVASLGIPIIVPASVFGKNAPSNRITIGMIGTGRQGYGQNLQGASTGIGRIPGILEVPDAQVVAVCDVDSWRVQKAKEVVESYYARNKPTGKYKGCTANDDFREVIGRKDIDAVIISTPDFWHVPMGIMAAQAKKHICCEKPLSLSVQQGRELVTAIAMHGVVNRTDSEFRSIRPQNQAVELVRNGHLGKLHRVEIQFPSDPTPVPPQPDMAVPKELNYEMWLGPTAYVPYTDFRVHTPFDLLKRPNWMRVASYAQGMIANWGAHYFDMVQWANNSELSGPVEVEGKGEFPQSLWNSMINFKVDYKYTNGLEMTCQQTPTSKPYIKYIGEEGWILVEGYPGKISCSNPSLLSVAAGPGHLDLSQTLWDKTDFINAIKEKRKTLEPIEVGHRTISVAQIGHIACQVGGRLTWNPAKELFEGNNAANALLTSPPARKPWLL